MSSKRDDHIPMEWTRVDRLPPVDLSNIGDRGMKGIALLAVALGWNLYHRKGAPAQIKSRSGLVRNLPTDTGVRQSVFWSMVASVLSHSDGKLPTDNLIDQIVKQSGMSQAHAQVLKTRLAQINRGTITEELPEEVPPTPEMTEAEQWAWLGEAMVATQEPETEEAATTPVVAEPEVEVGAEVRVEPTLNHAGSGDQYVSEIMETVIRRLIPEGEDQITYRCKVCGLELPSKRGVGSHYQVHVKAGEAKATAGNKRVIVNRVPDYVPSEVHTPKMVSSAELRRLQRIIADVQKAVGGGGDVEKAEQRAKAAERKAEAMQKERDDAIARAERLASDLRSLRDLIGGISDE
jgi:hypothetical protein